MNLKENTFINKENFEPSWYKNTYEDKNTFIYPPVNFLILFLVAEKHTLVPEQSISIFYMYALVINQKQIKQTQ